MEDTGLNLNARFLSVRRSTNETKPSGTNSVQVQVHRSSLSLEQVTEPVSVPFLWESIPGKSKDEVEVERELRVQDENSVTTPRVELPPGRCLDIVKYDSEFEDQGSYSDSVDQLSISDDSFSMKCSISGLDDEIRVGNFCTDQQTRDLMMSRFLPAAKAMALEPPQYSSKKNVKAAKTEPVRQNVKPSVSNVTHEKSVVVFNYEEEYTEDGESGGEENAYEDYVNLSRKKCGFLPSLFSKSIFTRLNRLPGIKSKIPSTKNVKKHDSVNSKKITSGFDLPPNLPDRCRLSPYRRSFSTSPYGEIGVLCTAKENKNRGANLLNKRISQSQELIYPRSSKLSSCSMSPAIEKILYIDTQSFSEIRRREYDDTFDNSLQDFKKLRVSNEAETRKGEPEPESEPERELDLDQECKALARVNTMDRKLDPELLSPIAPPLPKKPTESWLWRSSPSHSSRKPFSSSYFAGRFNNKSQNCEAVSEDSTKWETIVKTSNLHHDHMRYSEELTNHVSHQSKT